MSTPVSPQPLLREFPDDVGVLLIGHGSVDSVDDIPLFLQNIRRGRPTPDSIVQEVTHRFKAIGGSPLAKITAKQAELLALRLGLPVEVAGRMWHPYASEAVQRLVAKGVRKMLSLPLAPYSVHLYNETAREAAVALGVTSIDSPPWGTEPALIETFARAIESSFHTLEPTITHLAPRIAAKTALVLSAHSLPMRVVRSGDPYEQEVRATAEHVVHRVQSLLHWMPRHVVAFQSQGMDGGEWLGPDLPTTFDLLAAEGVSNVVVSTIGFLADHTEVLFDIDIEARELASQRGIQLIRADSPNVSTTFVDALESVARQALASFAQS